MAQQTGWQKDGHQQLWQSLLTRQKYYDIVVIGGGITGAGIAREAVRHGQKVLLVERQDFAWGTSSRSSKMVHGGLRYMAQGDFKTTRDSVHERERLLQEAPGLVQLMTYAMPHYKGQFPPAFLFNALLWLYDLFAGKKYRHYSNSKEFLQENPFLQEQGLLGATQFVDAVTDDSRLVMRVLHEASAAGADCINYVAANKLIFNEGQVVGVSVENTLTQETLDILAPVVINATGAWVDELRSQLHKKPIIRPARGSHLVVAAELLPAQQSLTILHPEDKRPIFIYPWEGRTVIGTTDIDHGSIANTEVSISVNEYNYLLALIKHYFPKVNIGTGDIISSFSGVRPLISSGALNPSKEKRNHSVWYDSGLVSVSGGKLTTFRLIAQDTLARARAHLPSWQPAADKQVLHSCSCQHPQFQQLPQATQQRLLGFYGQQLAEMFAAAAAKDLEFILDTPMLWIELRFAARHEMVQHLDDLLLRRTRLGLLLRNGGEACFGEIETICTQELGWDAKRWNSELERYQSIIRRFYSLPLELLD